MPYKQVLENIHSKMPTQMCTHNTLHLTVYGMDTTVTVTLHIQYEVTGGNSRKKTAKQVSKVRIDQHVYKLEQNTVTTRSLWKINGSVA